jgi:hypothetical protein
MRSEYNKAAVAEGVTGASVRKREVAAKWEAEQFAEKHDPSTSAAKACTEEKGFIAALKRCATQNHCFSANSKVGR